MHNNSIPRSSSHHTAAKTVGCAVTALWVAIILSLVLIAGSWAISSVSQNRAATIERHWN
jgi:hypothetical protein